MIAKSNDGLCLSMYRKRIKSRIIWHCFLKFETKGKSICPALGSPGLRIEIPALPRQPFETCQAVDVSLKLTKYATS